MNVLLSDGQRMIRGMLRMNLYDVVRYVLLKLCDLQRKPAYVSLLLFGAACDKHWQIEEGSVTAVLNASTMNSKANRDDKMHTGAGLGTKTSSMTMSINQPDQLLVLGSAQWFGRCQGRRKIDGKLCLAALNMSVQNSYHATDNVVNMVSIVNSMLQTNIASWPEQKRNGNVHIVI